MINQTRLNQPRPNQPRSNERTLREFTGYLFILTILALGFTLVWMLARMFQPRGDWHSLATLQELDYDTPTLYLLTSRDDTRVRLWLTIYDGKWRAFDGFTPTTFTQHCWYFWQPVTSRFQDPCSGAKFALDGTYIEQLEYAPRPLATDLVQYHLEFRDEQLWVNLDDKMKPAPVAQ